MRVRVRLRVRVRARAVGIGLGFWLGDCGGAPLHGVLRPASDVDLGDAERREAQRDQRVCPG